MSLNRSGRKYPIVTKCTKEMVFYKIVTKSRFVTKLGVTKSRLHWTHYVPLWTGKDPRYVQNKRFQEFLYTYLLSFDKKKAVYCMKINRKKTRQIIKLYYLYESDPWETFGLNSCKFEFRSFFGFRANRLNVFSAMPYKFVSLFGSWNSIFS